MHCHGNRDGISGALNPEPNVSTPVLGGLVAAALQKAPRCLRPVLVMRASFWLDVLALVLGWSVGSLHVMPHFIFSFCVSLVLVVVLVQ